VTAHVVLVHLKAHVLNKLPVETTKTRVAK